MNKELNAQEIKELKATYGQVFKLNLKIVEKAAVPADGDTKEIPEVVSKKAVAYVVKPDLTVLEALEDVVGDNVIRRLKFLTANCVKAGDASVLTDGELVIACGKKINSLFKTAFVEVEEL